MSIRLRDLASFKEIETKKAVADISAKAIDDVISKIQYMQKNDHVAGDFEDVVDSLENIKMFLKSS